jgi:type II secretion system protein C
LSITVFIKTASIAGIWFLPSQGVDMLKQTKLQMPYRQYSLVEMSESAHKEGKKRREIQASSTYLLKDIVLKGIYGSKKKGYVILALQSAVDSTELIGISESYKGYTLIEIEPDAAILESNGRNYRLKFEHSGLEEKFDKSRSSLSVDNVSVVKHISRVDINYYRQDMKKLWMDIGLSEVKKGKKILGFKVTRINSSSPLAQLGIHKGDLLTQVNNMPLTSYAEVMELYKSIDSLYTLELTVLRNNKEMEITYEIN